MKKAIVIGAGIGGLASAVRLAVKGYQVEVYEANSYPGGKLSQFEKNGFRFDAGPSLFTMPELVEELFITAGKNPKEHFNYIRLNEICKYFYEDGTILTAFGNKDEFAKEAFNKTGVDKNAIIEHLNKSAYIYHSTAHLFLEKSLHKIKSYLSLKTLWSIFQLPFLNIFTSMDAVNKKALKNEKMRQLFNRYATYNGSNPYKAPGILNIIPHLEFNMGAYFPKGGMYQITESIYKLACSLNVKFHFNSKVEKIIIEDKKAVGIIANSKEEKADIVVCNMDVVPAYRYLMPEQKQPEKILKQERSSSALIFYWGIKKEFPQLILHNIFFSKNYQEEFYYLFDKKTIYHDPTVYINITSKEEKSDAPEGMENWFVMINVPYNDGQDWEKLITEARKNILTKLSKILNTDVETLIICEDILDPRSIESKTQSYKGALYGTSSNSRMAAFFRHPNFSKEIDNLYFCGGSVHPGGGIPLALSSAKIVDSLIKPAQK
ncbi:MAG: 1-hydroxycarotenoid 3,4-desaturase CrtD [Bacteroidia bacterium]